MLTPQQLTAETEIPLKNLPVLGTLQHFRIVALSGQVIHEGDIIMLVEDEEVVARIEHEMREAK